MRRPCRVALLMTDLDDLGVQRVVVNLCNHFDRSRVEPILVLWHRQGKVAQFLKDAELVYETDPGLPWPRFVFRLPRYAHILRKLKPDLVLSFVPGTNLSYALLKPFMLKGVPFIASEHAFLSRAFATGEYRGPFKWIYFFMLRWIYNRVADRLIMTARAGKQDAVEMWGLNADRIKVIYNPQDIPDITRRAAEEVHDIWFDGSKPLVIGAGRLCVQKGFSTLLRSFCLLRKRTDARLVILGRGDLEASLKKLAVELGISEHVRFLGFQSNHLRYIRRASVFALSSIWEAMPMVLAETMVAGTPIVAFDCPSGPYEMLDAGRCGYLVADQDVSAFADALYRAITNPDEAQSKAALAQTKAKEFDVSSVVCQYMDLIEETIASKYRQADRIAA